MSNLFEHMHWFNFNCRFKWLKGLCTCKSLTFADEIYRWEPRRLRLRFTLLHFAQFELFGVCCHHQRQQKLVVSLVLSQLWLSRLKITSQRVLSRLYQGNATLTRHCTASKQCCMRVTCVESESSPKSLGSSLKSSRKSLGPSLKSSPKSLYSSRKSSHKSLGTTFKSVYM